MSVPKTTLAEQRRTCETAMQLYRSILKMPPNKGGVVLWHMMSIG